MGRHKDNPPCQKLKAILPALLLAALLASCVIPVFEEKPFEPDLTAEITVGQSDRSDVLFALGEPYTVGDDQRLFAYTAAQLHAVIVIAAGYDAAAIPVWTTHNLVVVFDETGKVEQIERTTGDLDGYCIAEARCFPEMSGRGPNLITTRIRWKETLARREAAREKEVATLQPRAQQGDADAQLAMADHAQSPEQRWRWICLAAHGGHMRAQHLMAARFQTGILKNESPDDAKAYLWYRLAADNGDEHAEVALPELAKAMTPEQLERAQSLVINWRPDAIARDGEQQPT